MLVSTPVHLRALVDSSVDFSRGRDRRLRNGAPAPELAHPVEQRLGAVLIEFFGSTETCVIATRRTAHESGWRAYPGVRLVPGEHGTEVSAPWLPQKQFLHDIVVLRTDGTFTIAGRGSDMIEVAGKRGSSPT